MTAHVKRTSPVSLPPHMADVEDYFADLVKKEIGESEHNRVAIEKRISRIVETLEYSAITHPSQANQVIEYLTKEMRELDIDIVGWMTHLSNIDIIHSLRTELTVREKDAKRSVRSHGYQSGENG